MLAIVVEGSTGVNCIAGYVRANQHMLSRAKRVNTGRCWLLVDSRAKRVMLLIEVEGRQNAESIVNIIN